MGRPRARHAKLLVSILWLAATVGSASGWPDSELLERFLTEAEVIESRKVETGITQSVKLTLTLDGETRAAIFKDFDQPSDSWRREVAAYELDKLLGLGMVPPTVEGKYRGRRGCVQLWVEGSTLAEADAPVDLASWQRQVSEMWLFDYLTGNIDRHVGNALMTPDHRLVLIDNSKAFQTYPGILAPIDSAVGATRARFWMTEYDPTRHTYPTSYRKPLLERVRALSKGDLKAGIGAFITAPSRRAVLDRRIEVLEYLGEP